MALSIAIDQVMVRKLGGWSISTVEWWLDRSEDERKAFIAQDAVQFIANGQLLDIAEAMRRMAHSSGAAAQAGAPTMITWPNASVPQEPCVYVRMVVDGPRWELFRQDAYGRSTRFAALTGRNDPEPYDIKTQDGSRALTIDLLGDALGLGANVERVLGAGPLEGFRSQVLLRRLGPRAWSVSDRQIRSMLEETGLVVLSA